jgi:hypothetical protein
MNQFGLQIGDQVVEVDPTPLRQLPERSPGQVAVAVDEHLLPGWQLAPRQFMELPDHRQIELVEQGEDRVIGADPAQLENPGDQMFDQGIVWFCGVDHHRVMSPHITTKFDPPIRGAEKQGEQVAILPLAEPIDQLRELPFGQPEDAQGFESPEGVVKTWFHELGPVELRRGS